MAQPKKDPIVIFAGLFKQFTRFLKKQTAELNALNEKNREIIAKKKQESSKDQ